MVLDKGFMMEFDTPQALVGQRGIFYNMARDAGLVENLRTHHDDNMREQTKVCQHESDEVKNNNENLFSSLGSR